MSQQNNNTVDGNGKNKPAAECRYGNVKATVWGNRTDFGMQYSVKLSRSYTKNKQWLETDYIGAKDLFKAIEALRDAGKFMLTTSKDDSSDDDYSDADAPAGQF